MLEEVVAKRSGECADEAQLRSPNCSTFEVSVVLNVIMEENWAHSVDQCWLQPSQFSMYLIGLLSMLLRCNDFSGIQKAMVYQTGSNPPDSGRDLSLVQVWLREVHWSFVSVQPLSSLSSVVV